MTASRFTVAHHAMRLHERPDRSQNPLMQRTKVGAPALPISIEDLAEQLLSPVPDLGQELSDLLGVRVLRPSRREIARARSRLKKHLATLRPFIIGLAVLDGSIPPRLGRHALLEGFYRANLANTGTRLQRGEDGVQALLRKLEEMATVGGHVVRHPAYGVSRAAMVTLAERTLSTRHTEETKRVRRAFFQESSAVRKLVRFGRALSKESRQWRPHPPSRFSGPAVDRIAHEYSFSAKAFETGLRYLASLAEACEGRERFHWWATAPLAQVAEHAGRLPILSAVPALIDRNVRNALAHGLPEPRPRTRSVLFHDSWRTVEWSLTEFFDRTRTLTASTIPFLQYAEIESLVHFRAYADRMWRAVAREAARLTPPPVTPPPTPASPPRSAPAHRARRRPAT